MWKIAFSSRNSQIKLCPIKTDLAEVSVTRGPLGINILCSRIKRGPIGHRTNNGVSTAEPWQLKMWPTKHQGLCVSKRVKRLLVYGRLPFACLCKEVCKLMEVVCVCVSAGCQVEHVHPFARSVWFKGNVYDPNPGILLSVPLFLQPGIPSINTSHSKM